MGCTFQSSSTNLPEMGIKINAMSSKAKLLLATAYQSIVGFIATLGLFGAQLSLTTKKVPSHLLLIQLRFLQLSNLTRVHPQQWILQILSFMKLKAHIRI
jgi:hypothetical protein